MSTISRLNKFQRLRYLNPENYLNSNLCFWRTPTPGSLKGYSTQVYEDSLNEWMKGQQRNIKNDNR